MIERCPTCFVGHPMQDGLSGNCPDTYHGRATPTPETPDLMREQAVIRYTLPFAALDEIGQALSELDNLRAENRRLLAELAELRAERDRLTSKQTRNLAEWFRHGLHDPNSLRADELRRAVRSFGAALRSPENPEAAPTEDKR